MSNSTANLFKRHGPQRIDLCECTVEELNRDKSSEAFFDSKLKPVDRKKLSISGTLQKKKQLSLKKKQCKNKVLAGKPQIPETVKQVRMHHDEGHVETQQNQPLAVNIANNPTKVAASSATKSIKHQQTIPLYRVSRQEIIRRQQVVLSPPPNVIFINMERASPACKHIPQQAVATPVNISSPFKSACTVKASGISKQPTSADTASLNKSTDRSDNLYPKGSQQKQIVPKEVESIYGDSEICEVSLEESMEGDTSRQLKESIVLSRMASEFSKIRITKSHYNKDRKGNEA